MLIEHEGHAASATVEFLFGGMNQGKCSPAEAAAVYRFMSGTTSHSLQLLRNGIMLYEGCERSLAADMLLAQASRDLADKGTGGMLFHSAALSWQDGLIMLPAGISNGKSTLTLWLTTKGLGYLSDESVFVPHGAKEAIPFRRPLSLKPPSRAVLQDVFDFDENRENILSSVNGDLIHSSALKGGTGKRSVPVRLVIFPRYEAGAAPSWEPLSRARTAQELMQSLVNARNLPDHGFSDVVQLTKDLRGYRAVYSDFIQIAEALGDLIGISCV